VKRTWLILDVNYLGWRALHAIKGLSHGGDPTGVTYGIFRDVLKLQDEHATRDLVFCFDYGPLLRKKLLPSYKEKRHSKEWIPQQLEAIKGMKKQIALLRTSYLKKIGYRNVFFEEGYEADDIIASVVYNMHSDDRAIVVSADKDLYQLLDEKGRVMLWNPTTKEFHDSDTLKEKVFGLAPEKEWEKSTVVLKSDWPMVKAVAGCLTDEIPGVKGVGEKTAIKYLLNPGKVRPDLLGAIADWVVSKEMERNLKLVKLPFDGCPKYKLQPDEVDPEKWRKLCDRLGMQSIRGKCPGQLKGFGFPTIKIRRSED
jgi:DNA polymerase I